MAGKFKITRFDLGSLCGIFSMSLSLFMVNIANKWYMYILGLLASLLTLCVGSKISEDLLED